MESRQPKCVGVGRKSKTRSPDQRFHFRNNLTRAERLGLRCDRCLGWPGLSRSCTVLDARAGVALQIYLEQPKLA